MITRYIPYFIFVLAVLFYLWVKDNQRGEKDVTRTVTEYPFARDTSALVFTDHARCRMDCRNIDEGEVKQMVREGIINYDKVESDKRGKRYPLEGITRDEQRVRVVVAPANEELVVVTVIDLDREWPCECD